MSIFNISHGEHFLKVSLKSVCTNAGCHTLSFLLEVITDISIMYFIKTPVVETSVTRGQHFSHFAYECAPVGYLSE